MKCFRNVWYKLNNLITVADFFAPPILLRYESDDKKPTKAGGCFSLLLIIIILSFFANSWVDVLDKREINSESYILRDLDPTQKQITNQDFLFTVSIVGIDIFDKTNRYFDVIISQQIRINSTYSQSREIDMIQCNRSEFQKYGDQFASVYDNLYLNSSLCFPPGFKSKIGGKWASPYFAYVRVHIKRCSGEGCISDEQFQNYLNNFGAFYVNYYFVNKLINPTKLEPISIYFQDKNYNMLNDKIAIDTNLYLSEYILETDESLLPIQQMNKTTGVYVDNTQKQQFIHPAQNGSYAQFHIRKSDQKIIIKRSFRKIDDLLSYIGGLFGILASVFGIVISHYNQCCFEMEMCYKVFDIDDNNYKDAKSSQTQDNMIKKNPYEQNGQKPKNYKQKLPFNFWIYLKYLAFVAITSVCTNFKWKQIEQINEKLEQSRNQLNIDTLLQKISFYQRSFQCLFDDDQMLLLYLQQKISLRQLKKQRMLMNLNQSPQIQTPGNQIANAFYLQQEQKNKSKKQNKKQKLSAKSLAAILGSINVEGPDNIRSTIAIRNIQQEVLMNFKDEIEINEQISQAFQRMKKRAQNGDKVCQRILNGVREQIMCKFQQWKSNRNMPNVGKKKNDFNSLIKRKQNHRISGFSNIVEMLENSSHSLKTNSQKNSFQEYNIKVLGHNLQIQPKNIKIYDIQSHKNIKR